MKQQAADGDQRLQELCDKQEITEVLYRYARGWDRRDPSATRSCFHPDSTHFHGGFEGTSMDFIEFGVDMTKEVMRQSHMITNPMIVVRGDAAISECSFLAYHRRPSASGGEEEMFLKGRYIDRFERRDGKWKIAKRVAKHDFERVVTPLDPRLSGAPESEMSAPCPDDVLYAMLDSLK